MAFLLKDATAFKREAFSGNDGYDIRSHMTGTSRSLSVPGVARAVVKAIMTGTREVGTASQVSRKFLKRGAQSDAVADFNSFNSDIINTHGYGAMGVTGDTKVKLRLIDSKYRGLPSLQIWQPNMDKSIKIYYIDKPIP